MENDQLVVVGGATDSNMVSDATTIKYTTGTYSNYEADILNVFLESQIAPPIIDYENQTVIATVSDTIDLQYLVPYIAISDYACRNILLCDKNEKLFTNKKADFIKIVSK